MKIGDLNENDRQAFLKVCVDGALGAGRALATFVGVPDAELTASPSLVDDAPTLSRDVAGAPSVVVAFELSGEAGGVLIHMLTADAARRVAGSLLGVEAAQVDLDDERVIGALSEVGNIVASAFLNAIAATVGAPCLPSVPDLSQDEGQAAVERAIDRTSASLEVGIVMLDVALAAAPELHFGLGFIPDGPALTHMSEGHRERAGA